MLRAVLLGCLTALAVAAALWYGWLGPSAKARAGFHGHPPVALPAAEAPARTAPGGTESVEPGAAPRSEPDPTVLLPDLRVLPPSDLALIGSRADGSLRLKFTTIIWNGGDGPVEVRGAPGATGELEVRQYVHSEGGEPRADAPVGTFDYQHRHGHLHLGEFARYELWSLDGEGRTVELVAQNPKVGFCLMDNLTIDERAPDQPVYSSCDGEVQGISVGYGDLYVAELYEQDLDVSHLPDGPYRLLNITNPAGAIRELDVGNNSASVDIVLRGASVAYAGR